MTNLDRSVLDARFRANPALELVLFDRLGDAERASLAALREDPDFYGVLRSRNPGFGMKTVSRDSALLFLSLAQPGRLPGYFLDELKSKSLEVTAKMVLDGVLEIESPAGFVGGAAATRILYSQAAGNSPESTLASLSREAVRYAARLNIQDAGQLSARIYFYNRLPPTPQWARTFANGEAAAAYLDGPPFERTSQLLETEWIPVPPAKGNEGWRIWRIRDPQLETAAAARLPYKLYVSPQPSALRDAFRIVVACLSERRYPRFKVGADLPNLMRPDKLVIYLPDFETLQQAAELLLGRLEGIAHHGVPFTAAIDSHGLLSWGMDPPRLSMVLPWQRHTSWRMWVTQRLATSLIAARCNQDSGIEPWQFALERLAIEGVDLSSWSPSASIFGQEGAGA